MDRQKLPSTGRSSIDRGNTAVMTEEQRHREKNKENLLEKGRVCNGGNKDRPQKMVCD